ncbi:MULTISPECIES: hypothetical protein [Campylobacter]|uniref:Uncharacterized protein n=1 Tax=Campylobacter jejuni subsp. jejuni serotype O:23/36 (strain 81-176) TaxID=354242 RepID=Q8GJC1_CAMJJ|nr:MULTISPECIES: hypothetical protein [Campylobacter]EAK7017324.1 hypothetical protein [Campylobacter jejuni]ETJ81684.1 hypothetical protein X908_07830 [Campylobacter jejuni subsp. jejuni 81-176-DRH212]ETN89776.1 hypothetical protein X910_09070 [Campylobacter jejuni subsp. jejuni 81-176-UMCW9]AAN46927.1 unknown [Campylobacter jejuni subsp. jejuni 81-176]EAQ71748.1 conserved hypothetical protein [Campylobacter jejuni subsp. jejuni 81-176]
MEESIEKRINEIYQETLKQNFDEKYDILKQFDFISKNCSDEYKLRKDIIKKNFFNFMGEVLGSRVKRGFFIDFLVSIFCLSFSAFAIILTAVIRSEELFLNYCLIAGFFGFIGIWGFDSNLNALNYYADLYSKEFIRKRIFG